MTIRSRLLLLLLPTLIAFSLLISFFFSFNWSREIVLLGSFMTFLLITVAVYFIADRISEPVRQLNQAAMEIAAGDYEANIQIKGPKEVVELAHTLKTMSECLVEHMSRLRESSLLRERMVGEYECALLLQDYMLQKVINEFNDPAIRMGLISVPLSPHQKGLLLNIDRIETKELSFNLLEAPEPGFSGLFQLNQWVHLPKSELKDKTFIGWHLTPDHSVLHWEAHDLFPPLVWSIKSQQFIKGRDKNIPLHMNDMIFIFNSSIIEQFKTETVIEAWLGKVLRHFSEDGMEMVHTMLTNELTFLAKKQHSKHNYNIITLQLTSQEPIP